MGKHLNKNLIVEVDDLIIGAGITGSLLAFLCMLKGRRVYLLDKNQDTSASAIAAGIINPVTGKNFVKSWNIDVFLPEALYVYREVSSFFKIDIIDQKNIIRSLPNPGAENQWEARKLDDNYDQYVAGDFDMMAFQKEINISGKYAEIKNAYRVNLGYCIRTIKDYFKSINMGEDRFFEHDRLVRKNDLWVFENIKAQNIIFCEGYQGMYNPFFKDLPFAPTEGLATQILMAGSAIDKMIKDEVFLVPLGGDQFWIGGAYNAYNPEQNTDQSKKTTHDEIQVGKLIKRSYEIIGKQTAVRPTTKTRRPFILKHQQLPNMYMMNGMGTKGTSMAPYFTNKMACYLQGEIQEDQLFS